MLIMKIISFQKAAFYPEKIPTLPLKKILHFHLIQAKHLVQLGKFCL